MDLRLSQFTEFFDVQEQILKVELHNQDLGYNV